MFGNLHFIGVLLQGVFVLGLIEAAPKVKKLPKSIEKLPYTFEAFDLDGRTTVEYTIDIIPDPKYDEAIKLITEHFYSNLTVFVALGMYKLRPLV